MKIKEIPISERPREKLIKKGASSLSSSELLAIILGEGVKNVNANEETLLIDLVSASIVSILLLTV